MAPPLHLLILAGGGLTCRNTPCGHPGWWGGLSTSFRGNAEADRHAVPAIHRGDRQRQVDQLFLAELPTRLFVDLVRHVVYGDERDGFRPGQRRSLALGEERGLAPGNERVEALFGFAARPRGLRMQVDSIGAAVDLRSTDFNKLNQQRFLAAERGSPHELIQAAQCSAHTVYDSAIVEARLCVHSCISFFDDVVGTGAEWMGGGGLAPVLLARDQNRPRREGQAQGPLVHPSLPPVPTAYNRATKRLGAVIR